MPITLVRPRMEMRCPLCPQPLARVTKGTSAYYTCDEHGIFAPIRFFDSFKTTQHLSRELRAARRVPAAARAKPIACPSCGNRMFTTLYDARLVIDQCSACDGLWFDKGEINALPDKQELESEFPAPMQMPHVDHSGQGKIDWPAAKADNPVVTPSMMMGFAAEEEETSAPFPVATFLLFLGSLALTLRAVKDPTYVEQNLFLPQDPLRRHGLTLITSTFLHAGWAHLVGNMYFLFTVGDNVEDVVGPWLLAFIFMAGAIAGDFMYAWFGGQVPSLGASGGVFALMVFYACAFPKNRFRIAVPLRYLNPTMTGEYLNWYAISISAPVYIGFYAVFNLVEAYFQTFNPHAAGTNFLAHAGGIALGVLAFVFLGGRSTKE